MELQNYLITVKQSCPQSQHVSSCREAVTQFKGSELNDQYERCGAIRHNGILLYKLKLDGVKKPCHNHWANE